jgi:hypothetical protein
MQVCQVTLSVLQFAGATFIVMHIEITFAAIYLKNEYAIRQLCWVPLHLGAGI